MNSQKNSPRHTLTGNLNRSMIESLNKTNSYLNTSYQSMNITGKELKATSKAHQSKKLKQNSLASNKTNFGLSFYKMPNCQYYNDTVLNTKFLPGKRDHFLSHICKIKKFVPSPDKYEVRGNLIMKGERKREFSKLPRMTIAEQIIKKGASTPGPGTYRIDYKPK